MKTATFPSVRVEPELREAAEHVLQEGESLSGFVEQSIRESIARRTQRSEFISRGLMSRDEARKSNDYVSAEEVVARLEKRLKAAKARGKVRR
jgi:predicted transcriptional regulator